MSKTKTTYTGEDVTEFIGKFVDNEQKREDSFRLIDLMQEWSGFEPKMWGPTIIGFGTYQYKYASGHEGEAPIVGFSPRKSAFSLYVYSATEKSDKLLEDFGKFTMGKACIYIKKLTDIDISILKQLCEESIDYINQHFECSCRKK